MTSAHLKGAAIAELKQQPGLAVGARGRAERGSCTVPDRQAGADVAGEWPPRVRDGAHYVAVAQPCCYVRLHWQAVLHSRLVIVHDHLQFTGARTN